MSVTAEKMAAWLVREQQQTGALFHYWAASKRLDDVLLLRWHAETVVASLAWRDGEEPWTIIVDATGLRSLHGRLAALGVGISLQRLRDAVLDIFRDLEQQFREDEPQ